MAEADLPPESAGRLRSGAFSSGLSVPDFAACLHMGLHPVGLVQGYCVMKWSWYGMGSPYSGSTFWSGAYSGNSLSSYNCPHYTYDADHRQWGVNVEQPWVSEAWSTGFNSAYTRMVEEAEEAGAHGVIGVVDRSSQLVGADVREFHAYGTAVVIEDDAYQGPIWTSYLAGQRLAKLIEAGLFPLSVVASMASVRVWAVCVTEYLMRGSSYGYGADEITQVSDAEMQARNTARDHIRRLLGQDALHGAVLSAGWSEIGEGDFEHHCTLRGTRVRRFKDADPLPAPVPTVTLR
jgi:hypothetical protein